MGVIRLSLFLWAAFGFGAIVSDVLLPHPDNYAAVVKSTKTRLFENVTWIEFYKIRTGHYPLNIEDSVPEPYGEPKTGVSYFAYWDTKSPRPNGSENGSIEPVIPRRQIEPPISVPSEVVDPTVLDRPMVLYYRRVDDDRYYLRAVGPDGKPFTGDDIFPDVEAQPGGRLGLLIGKDEELLSMHEVNVNGGPDER